mgnify:CR=1 FL=1
MPYLIDGHNLIGQMPDLRLSDEDKESHLVTRLRVYLRRQGKTGTVIFDQGFLAGRSPLSTRELQVIFAARGIPADRLIIQRVQRDRNPGGLIVVSSDSEVQAAAARAGAQVRSANEFARAMTHSSAAESAEKDRRLAADEVDEWLRLFRNKKDQR